MDELSKWGVGLGIVIVALFPLSLPIIVLTLAHVVPLALPLVALALIGAVIAAPVLLARRLLRSRAGRRDRSRSSSRHPRSAPIAH